ncbi:Uncharacterised protein [Bordetella pertussis]|nr:Uncharacterised protein [Bordetella pertussis]
MRGGSRRSSASTARIGMDMPSGARGAGLRALQVKLARRACGSTTRLARLAPVRTSVQRAPVRSLVSCAG